jgi:hypothetical protein
MIPRDLMKLTAVDIDKMTGEEARLAVAEARAEIMEIYRRAVINLGLDPKILDQGMVTISTTVQAAIAKL